jgi:CubicO group peptidase (beta-lactamase class C family)
MAVRNEAEAGVKLHAIYAHRSINVSEQSPDRYLYSLERMVTKPSGADQEYAGVTWLSFFASETEIKDTVPVYLKRRKDGDITYYRLSRTTGSEDGYDQVIPASGFWAFTEKGSPGYALRPVYEHHAENSPGHLRYYYDLNRTNPYGWSDGEIVFWAVSPQDFFDRAAGNFFNEHKCPERALEATGVPGMAIAVAFRDGPPIAHSYGFRDLVKKDAVDENTVFQLASVSKPVTSTIIAALVGDGALDWNVLASQYDPSFLLREPGSTQPPDRKKQTVKVADLLAHCSGLPEHAGDLLEDIGYDRDTVLKQLSCLPVSPPRRVERYTNFGFTAAAVAATMAYSMQPGKEKISWEALAKERLYQRLGMTRTSSRYDDFKDDPNCAVGHQRFSRYPGQWEWIAPATPRIPDAQSPAGGVRSCAADMAKWMQLQLNRGEFGNESIVDAQALAYTHTRYLDDAGMGWNVNQLGDLSHSGAFVKGAATCVQISPALGVGITVLTNGEPIGVPEAVCFAFFDYLLGKELPDGQTMRSWLAMAEEKMRSAIPPPRTWAT